MVGFVPQQTSEGDTYLIPASDTDKNAPLTDLYLGSGQSSQSAPVKPQQPTTPLTDAYLTGDAEGIPNPEGVRPEDLKALATGALQGGKDVLNSVGEGIGFFDKTIAKLIGGSGAERSADFDKRVKAENDVADAAETDNPMYSVGRVGGQIAATAPLTPVKAIQGIKAAAGALPTVLSTGEAVAAPLAKRLAASIGTGAVGGGIFGATTNSTNDNGLAANIGENALGGAVGGPIVEGAGTIAENLIPGARKAIGNAVGNTVASKAGVNAKAANQILSELENEGMSINDAEGAVAKMGPDATLADVTPALQKYAGALTQRGGRTSSILENRFNTRANTANNDADAIVNRNLGPNVDLDAEKEGIIKQAQKDVAPDYDAAHNSTDQLNVKPIIGNINKQLESALGEKQRYLRTVKGFLYRQGKDAEGNTISVPRTSVSDLHETRMAIDNILTKSQPNSSVGNYTKRMLTDMRDKVDAQLKSNPQMKAADAKFAEKMKLKDHLDYGHEALDNETKESFDKKWAKASADEKVAIAKGIRANVGEKLQLAKRGQLAGAQQLLGKQSANRHILKTAFGPNGDKALDALSASANKRGTEAMVKTGSRTAINLRINNALDQQSKGGSTGVGDVVKGLALDATTGSLGTGSAIMGAKHIGGNILTRFREARHDAFAEGLADLISRSGQHLTDTFNTLRKVNQARNVVKPVMKVRSRLPVGPVSAATIGKPIVNAGQNKLKSYFAQ